MATISDKYGSHWGYFCHENPGSSHSSYAYFPIHVFCFTITQVRAKGLDPQYSTLTNSRYGMLQNAQLHLKSDMVNALAYQGQQARNHDGMLIYDQEEEIYRTI